ncbi:MAG: hypothetical protein U9Q79_10320, partial [Candidatus Hydrogenedentes bacterium]|nr:hypothetical protein [Candidatus Hydrogenedentota bacterium]
RGQIAWARQRGDAADTPAVWIERRIRRTMEAIHTRVHDVADAFPAFAQDRAPAWARWLLARCKRPMLNVLVGRAFADETGHTAYEAKTGLLLYTTVWPRVFRLNVTLWVLGQTAMLLAAAILAVFFGMATAAGPISVMVTFIAVALWSGFAVKRILLDPVFQAAALTAFEKMVPGSSVASDTEVLLSEVSEAFRELDERAREASELEKGRSF